MADMKRVADTAEDACFVAHKAGSESGSSAVAGSKIYAGPFSDPVYHQISLINGKINKMKKEQIMGVLRDFNLDVSGSNDVLKKRLKNFYKEQKLSTAHLMDAVRARRCSYKFLCIIDFEATCEEENESDYPHEIIEFPAILVDTSEKKIVDEFHSYCKPFINPELSPFCKNLTGISQEQVDQANIFPVVLSQFAQWLKDRGLGISCSYAICTDGPWDMSRFLFKQCEICKIQCPPFSKKWVNIRKSFSNFYKTKRMKLHNMLELLGMSFEGRPHCGLDDARNISRVVIKMLQDGADLKINESMKWNSLSKEERQSQNKGSKNLHGQTTSDFVRPLDSIEYCAGQKTAECRTNSNTRKMKDICLDDAVLKLEELEVDPEVAGTEKVLLRGRFSAKEFV